MTQLNYHTTHIQKTRFTKCGRIAIEKFIKVTEQMPCGGVEWDAQWWAAYCLYGFRSTATIAKEARIQIDSQVRIQKSDGGRN